MVEFARVDCGCGAQFFGCDWVVACLVRGVFVAQAAVGEARRLGWNPSTGVPCLRSWVSIPAYDPCCELLGGVLAQWTRFRLNNFDQIHVVPLGSVDVTVCAMSDARSALKIATREVLH
jgi:hypothetical protein